MLTDNLNEQFKNKHFWSLRQKWIGCNASIFENRQKNWNPSTLLSTTSGRMTKGFTWSVIIERKSEQKYPEHGVLGGLFYLKVYSVTKSMQSITFQNNLDLFYGYNFFVP